MEKYSPYIIIAVVSFFLTVGCEKEINPELPIPPPKIVVNSAFNAENLWAVSVSESQFFLDHSNIKPLKNADLRIYENGQFLEKLTYNTDIQKYTGQTSPQSSNNYSIEVKHDQLRTVAAQTWLPKASTITKFEVQANARKVPGMFEDGSLNRIQLRFQEEEKHAFYQIILFRLTDEYHWMPPGGEKPEEIPHPVEDLHQKVYLETFSPIFTHDYGAPTFSGNAVGGQEKEVDVFFMSYENWYYDEVNNTLDADTSPAVYLLYLMTLSEDYYKYHNSYQLQQLTNGDPFSEPVPIEGNIAGGFGIFGGYAFDSVRFEFKHQ